MDSLDFWDLISPGSVTTSSSISVLDLPSAVDILQMWEKHWRLTVDNINFYIVLCEVDKKNIYIHNALNFIWWLSWQTFYYFVLTVHINDK